MVCGLCSQEPSGTGYSKDLRAQWGFSLSYGGRFYMEDFHSAESREWHGERVGCFAIYDGHGGRNCVTFVKRRLFKAILSMPSFAAGDGHSAMRDAFLQVDQQFLQKHSALTCGTTASVALLHRRTLWVAHVGDSRAILVSENGVTQLTVDHKPTNAQEAARIKNKGASITYDDVPRVSGVLAVTRAFGNNTLKPVIDAEPEVMRHEVQDKDEFVIIASDGVWDQLSNEAVANIARSSGSAVRSASLRICEEAYRAGSMDNISVVIVKLNSSGPSSTGERIQSAMLRLSGKRRTEANFHGITTTLPGQMGGGASSDSAAAAADPSGAMVAAALGVDEEAEVATAARSENGIVPPSRPPARRSKVWGGSAQHNPAVSGPGDSSASVDQGWDRDSQSVSFALQGQRVPEAASSMKLENS